MQIKVKLPKLGLTTEEATLIEWTKSVGDSVAKDEVIAVFEVDKANIEIPAPMAGELVETLVTLESTVMVGDIIAILKVGN